MGGNVYFRDSHIDHRLEAVKNYRTFNVFVNIPNLFTFYISERRISPVWWSSLISLKVVALKAPRTIINLSDTKVPPCIALKHYLEIKVNFEKWENPLWVDTGEKVWLIKRWRVERINNGNIASKALALVAVHCASSSHFFSKKENVLVVVFSKI